MCTLEIIANKTITLTEMVLVNVTVL